MLSGHFLNCPPPKIDSTSILARQGSQCRGLCHFDNWLQVVAFCQNPRHDDFSSNHHTVTFSQLTFIDHPLPGACQARHTFPNGWTISVVAGPEDSGLYGRIGQDTFEVAVIRPNGNMLEDVIVWQTPVQVTSLMHLIEML